VSALERFLQLAGDFVGRGLHGHLVARYHIQSWVQRNTPKLVGYAQSLSKPALTVGKGTVSIIIELLTLFVLDLLLLLEGPKMWRWTLGQMTPGRSATVTRVAADVSQKVTGYMFGDLLTSLIAGIVVFVTMLILGVPFPLLWGLWVALVDFLPMIGRALPGIPTVLFAFVARGLTAGIVTAVVFAVYTQIENHVLNPVVMSKTVRINQLLGAALGRGAGQPGAGEPPDHDDRGQRLDAAIQAEAEQGDRSGDHRGPDRYPGLDAQPAQGQPGQSTVQPGAARWLVLCARRLRAASQTTSG
jgi:hypothetical protein